MLNVLYVLNSTYASGGATKSFLAMLVRLRNMGVTPIVVTPNTDGICLELNTLGIEVIAVNYRNNTYPDCNTVKNVLLFLPRTIARRFVIYKAIKHVYKVLRGRKISLVHTNVSVIDVGYRLAKSLKVPHIFHVREYGNLDFNMVYYPSPAQFHSAVLQKSHCICITKQIQEHHGLSENSLSHVVYNGIDVPTVDINTAGTGNYFLYAGRIEPAKELLTLLEAYAEYIKKTEHKHELWIAGDVCDKIYYNKVCRFIENENLQENVRFLGLRKDIHALMHDAVALIIPSRFEAFGRCMTEGMMNGCLVIGNNTGGTKEQFDNGVEITGEEIGIRYSNKEELTSALLQIDNMPADTKNHIRVLALFTAKNLYSPESNATQVYNIYLSIANE